MKIEQAAIFMANLSPTKGHEQSGYRPVLVLQNNILNKNLSTVVVAPITSSPAAKGHFTTCFLEKNISKLSKESVILLFQLRTLDQSRLKKFVSKLPKEYFSEVIKQLTFIF